MDYLYHYTSLETLALILSNKTICFNNLLYVDDLEEAETEDMGRFGRFVYVSCWTSDEKESIPLWNLYTSDMHGVRIGLPKFPFKKYYYNKGEYFFSEDIETYVNMGKIYRENKVSIVASAPQLEEIEYTNDVSKLFPKIKRESLQESLVENKVKKEKQVKYSFASVGKYKREEWKFQNEWRYIFSVMPMGMQEMNPPSIEKNNEIIRRIEDRDYAPPYDRFFFDLDSDVFDRIEILCGPKMNLAEKTIVKSLMEKYCPNGTYIESKLKIK